MLSAFVIVIFDCQICSIYKSISVAYSRGCQKARGRPLHMAPYKKEHNQASSLYTIFKQFLYNILIILYEISWTDFFWGLCPRHMAPYLRDKPEQDLNLHNF